MTASNDYLGGLGYRNANSITQPAAILEPDLTFASE